MFGGAILTRRIGSRRLRFASGRRSRDDALELKDLVERGAYRPVIDRVYPMAQVQDAHRHVEAWHKTGNVVLRIDPGA
jgi:NADPH:quinone reductase-like Zn-dependent oxidoreductase